MKDKNSLIIGMTLILGFVILIGIHMFTKEPAPKTHCYITVKGVVEEVLEYPGNHAYSYYRFRIVDVLPNDPALLALYKGTWDSVSKKDGLYKKGEEITTSLKVPAW